MNKNQLTEYNQGSEFLLYKAPDGDIKVDVLIQNRTIWLKRDRKITPEKLGSRHMH